MATNTYKKGQRVKLSTNFTSTEFDCHGSGCCSTTLINPKLVEYLREDPKRRVEYISKIKNI